MDDLIEALSALAPGAIGAVGMAVLTKGDLIRRSGMVLISAAGAYYSYEYVAQLLNWPTGLSSFIVGLLSAPVFDKLITELPQLPLAKIGTALINKLLGLKERE